MARRNKLRVLIVDDEPLAREGLRHLLREEKDLVVVGECPDGFTAIEEVAKKKPDILFLDIQMPELSGFDVLRAIGVHAVPAVVFVTAHDVHALRAFEVHAADYLLKPVDPARLRDSVERIRASARRRGRGVGVSSAGRRAAILREIAPDKSYPSRLLLRTPRRTVLLPSDGIDWIDANGDYVLYHSGGHKYLVRGKISEVETQLDPSVFVRIHRSTIVNLGRILEMRPRPHGDQFVILVDGTKLVLSRSYRETAYRRISGNR